MTEIDIGHQIRRLREREGLSLRGLAARCGLSFNAISRIERGENSPTVATLHRLATAFDVPITEFFQQTTTVTKTVFTPAEESIRSQWEGVLMESLGSGLSYQQLEVFRLSVAPGGSSLDTPVAHDGDEFVLCLVGEINYQVANENYILQEGDSLLFKARQPHGWRNGTSQTAVILIVFERAQQDPQLWQQHVAKS